MTEEQIGALPAGFEMDALVGRHVMGARKHQWVDGLGIVGVLGDYEGCSRCRRGRYEWDKGVRSSPREEEECVLPWSTNIAAAWEVVEIGCYRFELQSDLEFGYVASFGEFSGTWKRSGYARTAPLAICRAALKAVME